MSNEWHPHGYVPWDRGRNFAALDGEDWAPEQSGLCEVAKVAMITNLLTEDNLPSYHRGAANHFSLDGAWRQCVTADDFGVRHPATTRSQVVRFQEQRDRMLACEVARAGRPA